MSVSFAPPPDGDQIHEVQEDPDRRSKHHSFLSKTAGQIFDSFTKLYALLCFSIFAAIVFAREALGIDKELG